ncbi:alpha/beta fold hydrolase [Sphaerisporangium corydalis]|uniref:Alpha/beta fold hydrolase n=1 Tax=Sphaerisporangium corydalis TaxID=1441875 RepID=A0ABV9EG23_9ACTN|nr:alpha/beta hydrolase [Sphaerisporangium corydalis]
MTILNTEHVPGARLHYVLRGSGPLLVLVAGGDGDASSSDDLAARLADDYTVLTYDRRGLSGSTIDDPSDPPTVTTHADDLHHLLAAVTTEPAYVCGSSIGALISLELVSRHPGQVGVLVAHEPPTTQLLSEAERTRAAHDQREIEETHRTEGTFAALLKFAILTGIDLNDREPDVKAAPRGPGRLPNLEFFLTHDAPAVRRHLLDLPALKSASTRILPAVGKTSAHTWPHRCTLLLAEHLAVPPTTFPAGHNALTSHPQAFATRLTQLLTPNPIP